MPIQAPQWTDYLNCPVCCREFGAPPRSPISLGCGHTLCRHCLKHLHRRQCPFDQTTIQLEPEELVVNTALLQLAGYSPPAQPYHPPCIKSLPEQDRLAYDKIVRCMEHLAVYLKFCGNVNNSVAGSRLSRPMQRKLVTLLQCAMTDEEGRGRAARAARSLGERTVTELILQHQNPQQLSANLWAAVRARGCQFLGPAMQEEVLKLVLLALEDGSALSRKVLVMFVVQRLEPHFPQASKTSIGHVVQLLYRASCFKVSKRECDSSLMQLKEEFRTYESLRREHDAQIVQIATEAGLRIAPDQWSALLYGDTAHKSHMQSIIDKLQTPQSFAQSVQELFIALQRTGDPAQLVVMSMHLDRLAGIDASPDAKSPTWQQLGDLMTSLKEVVSGLIHYLQQQATGRDTNHNQKHCVQDRCSEPSTSQPSPQTTASTPTHSKYKVSMCRDAATRSFCPRGNACTFAHSEEELERYRGNPNQVATNGNYAYVQAPLPPPLPLPPAPHGAMSQAIPQPLPQGLALPPPMFARYALHPIGVDNYPPPALAPLPQQHPTDLSLKSAPESPRNNDVSQPINYSIPRIRNQPSVLIPVPERPYYGRLSGRSVHDEPAPNIQYQMSEYTGPTYHGPTGPIPYQVTELPAPLPGRFVHEVPRNRSPYPFEDVVPPSDSIANYVSHPNFVSVHDRRPEPAWPTNEVFNFEQLRATIPHCSTSEDAVVQVAPRRRSQLHVERRPLASRTSRVTQYPSPPLSSMVGPRAPRRRTETMYTANNERRAVGADRVPIAHIDLSNMADDQELEQELQALERRIDTEFKSD